MVIQCLVLCGRLLSCCLVLEIYDKQTAIAIHICGLRKVRNFRGWRQ